MTNTSISNAADIRILYKTDVSAKALLVINWLTEVVNCAESWLLSLWNLSLSPLNAGHACCLNSRSWAGLAAHCFTHSSVHKQLEGDLLN